MSETRFSNIGKIEAISRLYEGTPFTPFKTCCLATTEIKYVASISKMMIEGIDFDLVYFPLKHLGYKSVISATGELYATFAHPSTMCVVLGVSAKLDFDQIKELWSGIVSAAQEHGYKQVALDLVPSPNGLTISISATGLRDFLTGQRRPEAQSKDLICISGNLGAAFMGMKVLEREKKKFDNNATEHPSLETYKMLVGSYLKPELDPGIVTSLETAGIFPSYGYFITNGLADTILRLVKHSGFGAKIYADKIPFEGNTFQLGKEMNIDPISAAMNGGDDFRILYVIPILTMEKFHREFQTFDIIGHLAQPEAGVCLVTPDGLEMPIKAQGWDSEE